jgi:hypothetical protein
VWKAICGPPDRLDVYAQSVDNGRRVEWLKAAELAEADYAVFVHNLKEGAGKDSLRLARDQSRLETAKLMESDGLYIDGARDRVPKLSYGQRSLCYLSGPAW